LFGVGDAEGSAGVFDGHGCSGMADADLNFLSGDDNLAAAADPSFKEHPADDVHLPQLHRRGQFVLQVAPELSDGGDHVDDQGGGGVVSGQVVEVGQRPRQDLQHETAGLAPVPDGVDVHQVAAEPEQL
jgi:hypothetical protein